MARYTVTDNKSGRKYKSLSLNKAAEKSKLDDTDVNWAVDHYGRADTDTHTVKPQSRGKDFAFRG